MKTENENEIKTILSNRFNIDSDVQVLPKDKGEVLYLIEAVPASGEMSIDAVKELCDKIATALGGILYGTVNLDFTTPYKITFEMMVEVSQN